MKNLKKKITAIFLLMIYLLGNPTTMVYADLIDQNVTKSNAVSSVQVGIDKDRKYTNRTDENDLVEGDIVVTKSVESTGKEGEYKVSFNVIGKDVTETTNHPIYTVVVFDISNSMQEVHMKEARKGLVTYEEELGICDKNANLTDQEKETGVCSGNNNSVNKIAFVTFYEKAQAIRSTFSSNPITASELTDVKYNPNHSGTRYLRGLQAAAKIIKDARDPQITTNASDRIPDDAEVVVLFLSDGLPGDASYLFEESIGNLTIDDPKDVALTAKETVTDYEEGVGYLLSLKDIQELANTSIFTIGYNLDSGSTSTAAQKIAKRAEVVLRNVSTDRLKNFFKAGVGGLDQAIQAIATEVAKYPAATNATITEVPAEHFSLSASEQFDTKSVTVNGNTITFTIEIDKSTPTGTYPTNDIDRTVITYTGVDGKSIPVKINQSPTIDWVRPSRDYTVEYYYQNLDNEEYTKDDNIVCDGASVLYGEKVNVNTMCVNANKTYGELGAKDGFNLNNEKSVEVTIDDNNNVFKVYYDRSNYNYTVNYNYEKLDGGYETVNDGLTHTASFEATIDADTIATFEEAGKKDGFSYNNTTNKPLTISSNETENIINIYYTRNEYNYCVEYYFDNEKDDSKTRPQDEESLTAKFESSITAKDYYVDETRNGYKFVGIQIGKEDKVETTEIDTSYVLTITNETATPLQENLIKFFYEKRGDLKYVINYVYLTEDSLNHSETKTDNVFLSKITEDTIKGFANADLANNPGWKIKSIEPSELTIQADESKNVITITYEKRTDIKYTAEYYYQNLDNDEYTKEDTKTYEATLDEIVTERTIENNKTLEELGNKEGFTFSKTDPSRGITIKVVKDEDEATTNVIKLYYDRNLYEYTVNYHYEGEDKVTTETVKDQKFETVIDKDSYKEKGLKPGYVFEKYGDNSASTVGTDNSKNIVDIYYNKRTDIKYTVEYYYQGTDDKYTKEDSKIFEATLDEVVTSETVENEKTLKTYGEKTGYVFAKTDPANGITITVVDTEDEATTNVIRLYYDRRTDIEYTVEYYYQNLDNDEYTKEDTKTYEATFMEVVNENTTENSKSLKELGNKEGFTFSKTDPANGLTINADTDNVIKLYYDRNLYEYTVNYHYEGEDKVTTETVKDQKFETVIDKDSYKEKGLKPGYVFEKYGDNSASTVGTDNSKNIVDIYYNKRTDIKYTVEYYYQNLDNDEYTKENTKTFEATLDEVVTETTTEESKTLKELGEKDGFEFVKTDPTRGITIKVVNDEDEATTNVIKLYYNRQKYPYCVEHHYEDIPEVDKVNSTETYKFESKITDFAKKVIDGYYFESSIKGTTEDPLVISTKESDNVIIANYKKRTDIKYTVNYFYQNLDDDDYTKEDTKTYEATFKELVTENTEEENKSLKDLGAKEGFTFSKTDPANGIEITVIASEDEKDVNVINLYYDRDMHSYEVHYFYDNVEDEDAIESDTVKFGTVIEEYEDKVIDGYVLDKAEGTPLTVSSDDKNNIINVYYVIRNDLSYTVEYYFDNKIDEDLTEKVENQTFNTVIEEYEDKAKGGYIFDKVEGTPLTIGTNIEENVIKVYYKKAPKEEAIEIPQTGVELTTRNRNNYNVLIILFNLIALAFATKRKED